jgi:hypothetical protein
VELVEYENDEMLFLLPKSLLRSPSLGSTSWTASSSGRQNNYTVSSLYPSQERIYDSCHTLPPQGEYNQPLDMPGYHDECEWGNGSQQLPQPPEGVPWQAWNSGSGAVYSHYHSPVRGKIPRVASTSAVQRPPPRRSRQDVALPLQHAASVPALSAHTAVECLGKKLTKSAASARIVLSSESDSEAESPPNWISCFSSPRSKRKIFKETSTPSSRASRSKLSSQPCIAKKSAAEPIRYIDETPSDSSADLLYGSPSLVDYENFNRHNFVADKASQTARGPVKRKSRSLSRPRMSQSRQRTDADSNEHGFRSYDDLALRTERLNIADNTSSNTAVIRPKSHQYYSALQNGGGCLVTTRALVEDHEQGPSRQEPLSPQPYALYRYPTNYMVPSARHCTCESRLSSDSGLADVSGHVDPCPLSPLLSKGSLLSVASRPNSVAYMGSPLLSRRQSSSGSSQRRLGCSTTVSGPTIFAPPEPVPYHSSLSRNNYPPAEKAYGSDNFGGREDLSYSNSPSALSDELQRNHSRNLNISGQDVPPRLLAPAPLYRCSCGQEIPWGAAMPPVDYARPDKVPQHSLDNNKAISSVKYSASLDDLAMCNQNADPFLTAGLDQALSCSDLPATSSRLNPLPVSEAGPLKPAYHLSPPLVRHATHQTLFQSQTESLETSREESSARSSWQRTKETYKTGLYAHWWLNASLQPIWEETLEAASHPVLDTETSL